jgi:peptide chain release factor 2
VITFDPDALSARKAELEAETVQPGFWDDQRRAARTSSELARTQRNLDMFERLQDEAGELDGMFEMAAEDAEWKTELERSLESLARDLGRLQEEALFTGEYDTGPAVVGVHAGAGGTDSQDWAEMLLRMYLRWAEARGFKTELLEATPGEEAGLKSATFTLTGDNAYGIMQAEKGVHRLVRLSPFDSAHRRHTSFAQVEVSPFVDEDVDVEIDEADLRIDTYRSQGAGGQHVNKTDSAVRLTHIPTGIAVACQAGRSQHQNRDEAWKMLRARLYEAELQKREAAAQAMQDAKTDIGWGHQIRSYVLQPYQMVKDLRTEVETSDTDGVLDGDLDAFMGAALAQRVGATREG